MVNSKSITKNEFWAIIGGIIRKLEKAMNASNVDYLLSSIEAYGNNFINDSINASDLNHLII